MQVLVGNRMDLPGTGFAVNPYGYFLYNQTRPFKRSSLAGQFIRKQQCVPNHARKRTKPQMDRTDATASLPLKLRLSAFYDA
jgi:hypothetical protein